MRQLSIGLVYYSTDLLGTINRMCQKQTRTCVLDEVNVPRKQDQKKVTGGARFRFHTQIPAGKWTRELMGLLFVSGVQRKRTGPIIQDCFKPGFESLNVYSLGRQVGDKVF